MFPQKKNTKEQRLKRRTKPRGVALIMLTPPRHDPLSTRGPPSLMRATSSTSRPPVPSTHTYHTHCVCVCVWTFRVHWRVPMIYKNIIISFPQPAVVFFSSSSGGPKELFQSLTPPPWKIKNDRTKRHRWCLAKKSTRKKKKRIIKIKHKKKNKIKTKFLGGSRARSQSLTIVNASMVRWDIHESPVKKKKKLLKRPSSVCWWRRAEGKRRTKCGRWRGKKNGENPRDGCAIMSISSRKGAVTNEPVATATCNSSYFTFTFDGIFLFS